MAEFEQQHVHAVYNTIASDFSRTRHSRWPFVETFLNALPAGSVVLDAGCGNGKYLGCDSVLDELHVRTKPPAGKSTGRIGSSSSSRDPARKDSVKGKGVEQKGEATPDAGRRRRLLNVGFDMSEGLLGIAGGKGHEVVRGDCFDMSCWRRGSFDHAISIATIHHFATRERRLESIKQLITSVIPRKLKTGSHGTYSKKATILIVVWALEQDPALSGVGSARKVKKGAENVSRATMLGLESLEGQPPPQFEEDEQDVFVPWELQAPRVKKVRPTPPPRKVWSGHASTPAVGSSRGDDVPMDSTQDDDTPSSSPLNPPIPTPPTESTSTASSAPSETFKRYYHLFREGELEELVKDAALELSATVVSLPHPDQPCRVSQILPGRSPAPWVLQVMPQHVRWERENWVIEIGVQWASEGHVESDPE